MVVCNLMQIRINVRRTMADGVIGNTLGFGPNVEGSSPSPPASK